MRLYDWTRLKPGMKVARSVYSRDRLLLQAGTILNKDTIQRLPIWGIFNLVVETNEDLVQRGLQQTA
jgi:protein involved in sex pheromone biosynthesis